MDQFDIAPNKIVPIPIDMGNETSRDGVSLVLLGIGLRKGNKFIVANITPSIPSR